MKDSNDWKEGDATWELLGKAAPKEAGSRFADDTLRAVKLLPEADPWWSRILSSSPWVAVAACAGLAAFIFLKPPVEPTIVHKPRTDVQAEKQWVEIEEVADEELLAAAADHLDRFSDQELVTLIGF
jgi:hypothetical protein